MDRKKTNSNKSYKMLKKSTEKAEQTKEKHKGRSRKKVSKKEFDKKTVSKKLKKRQIIIWSCVFVAFALIMGGLTVYDYLRTKVVTEEDYWLEDIAYSTECIDDDSLEMGTREVERQGVNGKRKNFFETTKKFLTGEQVNWKYIRWEDVEQPVNEVARCGTRKWQYMWCSDGGYRYYTDEQFAESNIGFTHASEDFCAKNGQGTMIQLSDFPPAYENNSSHPYEWYVAMYGDPSKISENQTYTPTQQSDSSTYDDSINESENNIQNTGPDKTTANNICQSEANSAYQSLMRQLGAMGASGSSSAIEAQRIRDNTYNSCMRRYGF